MATPNRATRRTPAKKTTAAKSADSPKPEPKKAPAGTFSLSAIDAELTEVLPELEKLEKCRFDTGEVVSLVRWLGGVILTSSPKFKGGKIPKVEPYTQPVRIDGETGLWRGQRTPDEQRASHQRRVDLVKQAGERYRALQNK